MLIIVLAPPSALTDIPLASAHRGLGPRVQPGGVPGELPAQKEG